MISENPSLDRIGIPAHLQHLRIMIGFQCNEIRIPDLLKNFLGDIPCIGNNAGLPAAASKE